MSKTVLPFDCIAIEYLKLTERKSKKKNQNQQSEEFLIHPNTVSIPYSNTYQNYPLEFSLIDAVMVCAPSRVGIKMIASFALKLDSPAYQYMCALDERLAALTLAARKEIIKNDNFHWTSLINRDDGEIKCLLPFNTNKQPHLPCFDRESRCSVHHIKPGTPLKLYMNIHHTFLILPKNEKNNSGKYQGGAMMTINRIDIDIKDFL